MRRLKLDYPPARARAVRALAWLIAPWPVVRGIDYLTGVDTTAPALNVFNAAMPIGWWGVAFTTAGALLALGLTSGLHTAAWLGHGLCAAAYTGLAISIGQGVLSTHTGWRTFGPVFVFAVLHWALAVALKPLPPREPWSVDNATR